MLRFFVHPLFRFLILLLVLAGMFVALGHGSGLKMRIENIVFETYMKMKPRQPSGQLLFLDIDDRSLTKLGQWPWPRFYMAQIVRNLTEAGAQVIIFDGVLAEADRTSPPQMAALLPAGHQAREALGAMEDYDDVLAGAIKESGRFVAGFSHGSNLTPPLLKGRILSKRDVKEFMLSQTAQDGMYFKGTAQFLPDLQKAAAGNGSFMASLEGDAVIRKTNMIFHNGKHLYPSLIVEGLRLFDPNFKSYPKLYFNEEVHENALLAPFVLEVGQYKIPMDSAGKIWVNYRRFAPEEQVPAYQFVDEYYQPGRYDLKGKVIFIASEAEGLKDLRATPLGNIAGVKVHMNAFEQILQGQYMLRNEHSLDYEVFGTLGVCFILIVFSFFAHPVLLFLLSVSCVVGSFFTGWYMFDLHGYLLDPAVPSLMIICTFIAASLFRFLQTELERKQVRTAFGHYISPDFMKELASDPGKLSLGGETRDLTVMFSDIRGFTSISEGLSPQELISLMNDFLTPMSDIVMKNRGTIDKYMGDAMMAFWNAPLDDADHARHACISALAMKEALAPINAAQEEKAKAEGKKPLLLRAGIGLNSGPCAVGNMGSRQRFAYSTLGDAVNLASRLEGQTKAYGVDILAGESTYQQADDLAFLELDLIKVKGKEKVERIYVLLGDATVATDAKFMTLKSVHANMLSSYREGAFHTALEMIKMCRNVDGFGLGAYYDLMEERCVAYHKNPPRAEDWDGVYVALSK